MNTIRAVDDEDDTLELIRYNLEREGFRVATASSGEAALGEADRLGPDLILLDRMLPGIDGLEVCRRLKLNARTRRIPVIMLTARSDEIDVVTGLEVGADDYIAKPFSVKILAARVRAALRRVRDGREAGTEGPIRVGGLEIDPARHTVSAAGTELELSATEFAILELLSRERGRVFTRSQIIDAVRGGNYPVTERSVDMQILGLRRRLGAHGSLIQTVRGVGYRIGKDV